MMDVWRKERSVNPILFLGYRVVESGLLSVRETNMCIVLYFLSFCNPTQQEWMLLRHSRETVVDAKSRPKRIPR